ncbi:hypothetical protein ACG2LH_17410 [Zhouia sp. PK063]|uniref:hypothetical protein n=1 Tax=Zhouia sp. PK063 TaxID=3373602 RepID=UPI003788DC6C
MLITVILITTQINVRAITNEQLNNVILRLPEENLRLQSLIKTQVFSINKEGEIEFLNKQYPSSLIALLDQKPEDRREDTSKKTILKKVNKVLLSNIDELLSFINFVAYESTLSIICKYSIYVHYQRSRTTGNEND